MTEPTALFRQEALDFWTRQRGPGAVLRVALPWVRWLYWIVLALVVAGLALAFSARIHESAAGPALIDGEERTFVALLPAAASSDLRPDRLPPVEVDGLPGRRSVAAQALHVEPADDVEVRRAGFGPFPQPAMLVSGVLAPDAPGVPELPSSPRLTARAVVVVRSERLLTALLRGFEGTLEGGNT